MTDHRVIRAPRGPDKTCKTWAAEAAMRMLMNNLDPEVAEDPDNLVVYGGRGQAAGVARAARLQQLRVAARLGQEPEDVPGQARAAAPPGDRVGDDPQPSGHGEDSSGSPGGAL